MGAPRKPRPVLSERELAILFSEIQHFTRTFTLYWLAFRLGLGARQLSALDVKDVSVDGKEPAADVRLKRTRRYRSRAEGLVPLPIDTRGVVRRYLAWRRACVHFRLPMRTERHASGQDRCLVCREPVDFLSCPLFSSGRRGRLSPKTMQNGFAVMRNMLGLNPALRFDSLRDTFHAMEPSVVPSHAPEPTTAAAPSGPAARKARS
jgi:hypothetical protein